MLVEKHGGQVPRTFEELEELPGVGHKTASVVMVQAFGVPAFPVDTHIHRLAQRWKLTSGASVEQTERDLKKLFPSDEWNPLHLRIIYYGREHCTALGCDGTVCEICRTLFPERKRAVKTRK
jgi:endonuclease-3